MHQESKLEQCQEEVCPSMAPSWDQSAKSSSTIHPCYVLTCIKHPSGYIWNSPVAMWPRVFPFKIKNGGNILPLAVPVAANVALVSVVKAHTWIVCVSSFLSVQHERKEDGINTGPCMWCNPDWCNNLFLSSWQKSSLLPLQCHGDSPGPCVMHYDAWLQIYWQNVESLHFR